MRWIFAAALAGSAVVAGHAAKVEDLFPQPFGLLKWEKPPYTDEYNFGVDRDIFSGKRFVEEMILYCAK